MARIFLLCITLTPLWLPSIGIAQGLVLEPRFLTDMPIQVVPGYPSMDKSWPGRGHPTHIGKHSRSGMVLVEPRVFVDRLRFYADEPTAQVVAMMAAPESGLAGVELAVEVRAPDGKVVASHRTPAEHHVFSCLLDLRSLPAGRYTVEARFASGDNPEPISSAGASFEKLPQPLGAAVFPDDGVLLQLERQTIVADGEWPMRVGVPLPRGRIADVGALALFEDGRRIPADIYARAFWDPANRSIKWVHVHFLAAYRGGKPAEYRLRRIDDAGRDKPASPLVVRQSDERFEVDTGVIRFNVNRRKFNGIESLWHDNRQVIKAERQQSGPYLLDQDRKRFGAAGDKDVTVELEESGDAEAVIVARGWYTSDKGERLCQFTTRISAYAGQPMLRVRHYTTITFDTHQAQLADLGFDLPIRNVRGFRFGADGQTIAGDDDAASLHQERWDRFRTLGLKSRAGGEKLDGWFALDTGSGREVQLFVRDIWQKYPKEISLGRSGFTIHFWPRHGREVFTLDEQLERRNIYKFLCFHQGPLMDLRTPQAYVERFVEYAADTATLGLEGSHGWWRESEHDGTKSGNAQGVTIANDFALVLADRTSRDAGVTGGLFVFDPTASASPRWNCSTGALGDIAAPDGRHFTELEQAIEQGWLSWTRQVQRYNDYGMFNYADTHTVTNVAENRPGLHRVWQGSHYRNIGTNWLLWFRYGSSDLLRWARANTDHYLHIKTTNYVDRDNPVAVMDHELGAMQHMGWKTHWASSAHGEAWGQFKDVFGHFIDPEAALWLWLMTGDRRGQENYANWLATGKGKLDSYLWGTAREINTTLAYLVGAYEATWDPVLLPNIHTMALALRSTPLEKQQPGPLWHPLWVNRYHDLTRDAEYEPVIHKYARYWTNVESSSVMGLAAKSFDLGGDREILERLLPGLSRFPRHYFRKDGDSYDWWGMGPGPLGDGYASMLWGEFRARLERAGVTHLPHDTQPRGGYPFKSARYNYPSHPSSLTVYVLEETDRAFDIRFGLRSLGGSLHATSVKVLNPRGEEVLFVPRVESGDDRNEPRTIAADGMTGVYRVEFRGHEAVVPVPQTELPEAALIERGESYLVLSPRFVVRPAPAASATLTVVDYADRDPSHLIVESADGSTLGRGNVFTARDAPRTEVKLPADAAPWIIDVVGKTHIRFDGEGTLRLLCGSHPEHIDAIERGMRGQ